MQRPNWTTSGVPRTGASSARLYWESLDDVARWLDGPLEPRDLVEVPTGCTVFPHELQRPSRRWAERRFRDIRYWSEPDRGGHFPALEQPALFVEEIRAFFRLVRERFTIGAPPRSSGWLRIGPCRW